MQGVKCRGTNRDGGPCKNPPINGGTVCRMHGGGSPQARAAAEKRLAEAAAAKELAAGVKTLGLPVDIDPGKALLDEIHWTAGHVQWLRQKVQELETVETLVRGTEASEDEEASDESSHPNAHSLVWGQTEYRNKTGGDDAGQTIVEQAGINIWYQLYMKERDHLAKVCALALKAGIEERKVKLAESQGLLVAEAIRRILNALGLSPEQQMLVPTVVPRELRLLAAGE